MKKSKNKCKKKTNKRTNKKTNRTAREPNNQPANNQCANLQTNQSTNQPINHQSGFLRCQKFQRKIPLGCANEPIKLKGGFGGFTAWIIYFFLMKFSRLYLNYSQLYIRFNKKKLFFNKIFKKIYLFSSTSVFLIFRFR